MILIAVAAKVCVFITFSIFVPYSFAAAVTNCSVVFYAVRTNHLTVQFLVVICVDDSSAVGAIDFFFHLKILHK
jgi:hypothetical protein